MLATVCIPWQHNHVNSLEGSMLDVSPSVVPLGIMLQCPNGGIPKFFEKPRALNYLSLHHNISIFGGVNMLNICSIYCSMLNILVSYLWWRDRGGKWSFTNSIILLLLKGRHEYAGKRTSKLSCVKKPVNISSPDSSWYQFFWLLHFFLWPWTCLKWALHCCSYLEENK